MAVAAEAIAFGDFYMALITVVSVIVMPRPAHIELRRIGAVNSSIGAPNSIKIVMTSRAGAGWIVVFMT